VGFGSCLLMRESTRFKSCTSGLLMECGVEYKIEAAWGYPHLQSVPVEAARLAPLFNPQLKRVHEKELQRGQWIGRWLRCRAGWWRISWRWARAHAF
jgi:hypothetical protein